MYKKLWKTIFKNNTDMRLNALVKPFFFFFWIQMEILLTLSNV